MDKDGKQPMDPSRPMDPPRPMDLSRLGRLLDAYGADPRRWPEAERQAARDLVSGSAEAAALLERAAALDAVLDRAPVHEPSGELAARILAAGTGTGRRGLAAALWPFGPIWRPATVLAASATLGLALGLVAPPPVFADPSFGDALVEDALVEDIDDLAFGPDIGLEAAP